MAVGSEMDRRDFATSRVKKKRMKRYPSDLDLMLSKFVSFDQKLNK